MEEETEVYQQAFLRMLEKRKEQLLEERKINQLSLQKTEAEERQCKQTLQQRQESALHYQQALKAQIQIDQIRKEQAQSELLKGIDPRLHGYPHLPQTPKVVRRRREVLKQAQFSRSVSVQLAENSRLRKEAELRELQEAKQLIELDLREREKQVREEAARKQAYREKVRRAWKQADQAKRLIQEVEDSAQLTEETDSKPALSLRPKRGNSLSPLSDAQKTTQFAGKPLDLEKPGKSPKAALPESLTPTQAQALLHLLSNYSPKLPLLMPDSLLRSASNPRPRVMPTQTLTHSCSRPKDPAKAVVQERVQKLNERIRRNLNRKLTPTYQSSRTHSFPYQRPLCVLPPSNVDL